MDIWVYHPPTGKLCMVRGQGDKSAEHMVGHNWAMFYLDAIYFFAELSPMEDTWLA